MRGASTIPEGDTKSLLSSLYPPGQRPSWADGKREDLTLFGKEG